MACSQLYTWRQDPAIAGLRAQSREPDISQPVSRVAIPVDTLALSGDYWQKRHGCMTGTLRYRGYSVTDNQRIAVVRSNDRERIYGVGDEISDAKQARILSLDDGHVVLRYPDSIVVLCREAQKTSASVSSSSTTEPPRFPPHSELHTLLGTISPVTDAAGGLLGYRLQHCQRYCWLMRQFSLEEGDTINSIQGIQVSQMSSSELNKILVQGNRDIALTLQRRNETKSVTLPWNSIAPLLHFLQKEGG